MNLDETEEIWNSQRSSRTLALDLFIAEMILNSQVFKAFSFGKKNLFEHNWIIQCHIAKIANVLAESCES